MYAGKDGNVYKNTGSGWQKYNNGNWNSVKTPSQQRASVQTPQSQAHGAAAAQRGTTQGGSGQTQKTGEAQRTSPQGGGGQMQGLQSEAASRQRGAQSNERFEQRSSGGGGERSAGGGRRR
jgi:hypothetical protein